MELFNLINSIENKHNNEINCTACDWYIHKSRKITHDGFCDDCYHIMKNKQINEIINKIYYNDIAHIIKLFATGLKCNSFTCNKIIYDYKVFSIKNYNPITICNYCFNKHCIRCGITFSTPSNYRKHLLSNKHKRSVF